MPRWVHDGIRVNGQTWPVVRMQWVEGHTLNKHVDGLVADLDTRSLGALAEEWLELVVRLQRAEFAHGDLQHGNVLVATGGEMRLVDFDCSWITRFSGWPPPSETGHRNYQPETRPWGRWMDTFSALVIYTSLLALSKNPTPWHVLNTGENLLFRREDFRPPFDSATWKHLSGLGDRQVDQLARRLIECCVPGWTASASLGDLITPRAMPWWEQTQLATAGMGAPAAPPQPAPAGPPPPTDPQPVQYGAPPQAPRKPGANWWQDQPVRAASRGPAEQNTRTGRAMLAALGVGVLVTLLVLAVSGGVIGGALVAGFLVTIVAGLVGVAVARRPPTR